MAEFVTGQVTVGTTATKILSVVAPLSGDVLVSSDAAVFLGGSGVTASNGFSVAANSSVSIPAAVADNPPLTLYGIVSSGTAKVSFIFPS